MQEKSTPIPFSDEAGDKWRPGANDTDSVAGNYHE